MLKMVPVRLLGAAFLSVLMALVLAGCTSEDERLDELEERLVQMEERVAALSELIANSITPEPQGEQGAELEQASDELAVPPPSPLVLGETAAINGLVLGAQRYEVAFIGPVTPSPGAKFLWVFISVRNVGDLPQRLPLFATALLYKGQPMIKPPLSGQGDSDHPLFRLPKALYPGVTAEGWELWEVPSAIDLSQAVVQIRFGPGPDGVRQWRLR